MTLREHIAKHLMHSRIGMTRKDLINAIDPAEYSGDANRISDQLFRLKSANHADKTIDTGNGARWQITPQGRAYYSDLNDDNDETNNQTQPTETAAIPSVPMDNPQSAKTTPTQNISTEMARQPDYDPMAVQENETQPVEWHKNAASIEIKMFQMAHAATDNTDAVLKFNTAETLDRALYGLVKLIRDVASQQPDTIEIENKSEALALLETLETNDLYSGQHRATFARIRQAVELMECAA